MWPVTGWHNLKFSILKWDRILLYRKQLENGSHPACIMLASLLGAIVSDSIYTQIDKQIDKQILVMITSSFKLSFIAILYIYI